MDIKEKRSCVNCAIKDTCIERSTAIFFTLIATGRSDELTDETKSKFNSKLNCPNWKEVKTE